ncbi:transglycosylase SLT domain-containing protein [Actinokineospora auranticolor]|uniref:Type VII secretion system (Wss) protein ESAT-6 n=1 Tax=Actinokineospora auranticolor TaxID=155976 RepID=A0A2S6GRT9_9PSEU|nr:transglycosylase SLT domain-containing protein [Actinokineospora auranticolor]PPK67883.1 type VII secretion system (Wss) protein ESAT-6 [Actinokineospora auranticolor]
MTAKDDAAALGGTAAQLAATANKVYLAQPAVIGDLGTKFTTAATANSDSGSKVDNSVKQLDDAWQGKSADGFVAYMANYTKASTALTDVLNGAAGDLRTAATGLQNARDTLEGIFGDLHYNATSWLNANKDAPEEEKRSHVDGIASGYQGRVAEQVNAAEQVVSTAASALSGRHVDPKFSAIPDPNTQAFAPAPGKRIDWTPTSQPDSTTQASTAEARQSPQTSAAPTGNGHSGGSGGGHSGGGGGGGGGGGFSGGLGSSGGPPAGPPPGNVQEWIKQAIAELRARGINVTEADAQLIWEIIQHESGGNPNAINNWDSNAAKGTPSKGLMQCIDPTFQSYKIAGHDNIWNPVDNICAGVNYAISRYGSLSNVPGIKATHGGGGYVGY